MMKGHTKILLTIEFSLTYRRETDKRGVITEIVLNDDEGDLLAKKLNF